MADATILTPSLCLLFSYQQNVACRDKNKINEYAQSQDSDQPGLLHSLISKSPHFALIGWLTYQAHGRIQRGGQGVRTQTPEKSQKNRVSLQNWSGSPKKNSKVTKPAFNVGPSSARQRNAISMAFRWRVVDGLLIVVFASFLPSSN